MNPSESDVRETGLKESLEALRELAESVSDFHERWGESGFWEVGGREWLESRRRLLSEEIEEFVDAENEDHMIHEAVDVLFVALGTLDLLPADKAAAAMREVARKNAGKTANTHRRDPETGKVTRASKLKERERETTC